MKAWTSPRTGSKWTLRDGALYEASFSGLRQTIWGGGGVCAPAAARVCPAGAWYSLWPLYSVSMAHPSDTLYGEHRGLLDQPCVPCGAPPPDTQQLQSVAFSQQCINAGAMATRFVVFVPHTGPYDALPLVEFNAR